MRVLRAICAGSLADLAPEMTISPKWMGAREADTVTPAGEIEGRRSIALDDVPQVQLVNLEEDACTETQTVSGG